MGQIRTIRQPPWGRRLWPLLALGSFIGAWLLLVLIAARLLSDAEPGQESLFRLEGLAAAASFALAAAGAVFALREYRRADHNRQFHLHLDLVRKLMRPEMIEARRWVIENIEPLDGPDQNAKAWREKTERLLCADQGCGKNHVKLILNELDEMGISFSRYWSPDPDVLVWLAPLVLKPWIRIGPYVEWEARRRNAESHYYLWARTFAEDTSRWLETNRPLVHHSLMRERCIDGAL